MDGGEGTARGRFFGGGIVGRKDDCRVVDQCGWAGAKILQVFEGGRWRGEDL